VATGSNAAIPQMPSSPNNTTTLPSPYLIPRFTRTERAVHWTYAVFFLILLATGLVMELPFLSTLVTDRYTVRLIHFIAAAFLIIIPFLVALLGNWGAVRETAHDFDHWDEGDRHWASDIWNGHETQPGRFNAGQKLNATFTVGALLLFVVTGAIMLTNIYGRLFPLWLVSNASYVHDILTWFALFAWLGHVYLSVIHPSTRPSLRGMLTGSVRAGWAREHHPLWYQRQIATGPDTSTESGHVVAPVPVDR